MRHLTVEQLIDLAEGNATDSAAVHLQSCDACRRQVMDLREVISVAAEVDTPEPSPLFWEHFSARVRQGITIEPETSLWTLRGWRHTLGAWRVALAVRPRVAGLAVVVVAAVLLQLGRFAPVSGPSAPASVAVETPDVLIPVGGLMGDDPSLSLVADLAEDLDWDAVREAGLTTHLGVDEDALSQLTSGERGELRRLLQGELSPSRRGA